MRPLLSLSLPAVLLFCACGPGQIPDAGVEAGPSPDAGYSGDGGSSLPLLVEQQRAVDLAGSTVASASWATPSQHGTAFGGNALFRLEGPELVAYDLTALHDGVATVLDRVPLSTLPDAGDSSISGLALVSDPAASPERIWFTYAKPDWTGALGSVTFDGSAFGLIEPDLIALATISNFPIRLIDLAEPGVPPKRLVIVDDMAAEVKVLDLTAYQPGTALQGIAIPVRTVVTALPENTFLGAPYALGDNLIAVSYTGSVGTGDEGKGGLVLCQLTTGSATCVHQPLPPGELADSHVAVGGVARDGDRLYVLWDHYGAGYPAPRHPSRLLRFTLNTGPLDIRQEYRSTPLSATWPTGCRILSHGQIAVQSSPPDGPFQLQLFTPDLNSIQTIEGAPASSYYQPFYGVLAAAETGTYWFGAPTALVKFVEQ